MGELHRENRLRPAQGGEESIVSLFFPIIEHDNPLAWPLLGHEVGHVLVAEDRTTDGLVETSLRSFVRASQGSECEGNNGHIPMLVQWLPELVCDAVGCRVYGAGYMAAQVWDALGRGNTVSGEASAGHPALLNRIYLSASMLRAESDVKTLSADVLARLVEGDKEYGYKPFEHGCYSWNDVYEGTAAALGKSCPA